MRLQVYRALTLFSIFLATAYVARAQNHDNLPDLQKVYVIDSSDTVFIDISQANSVGNIVEIPVYFRSDDIINSVDFEFKYDHQKLVYDTILFMAPYIEGLSFYNTNDSTVRLTSYSFTQPYANDSIIYKIRFQLLFPFQICAGDLFDFEALLNGDGCSASMTDCLTGLYEILAGGSLSIFPNPASDQITVFAPDAVELAIADLSGRLVLRKRLSTSGPTNLNTSQLESGMYNLIIYSAKGTQTETLIIR